MLLVLAALAVVAADPPAPLTDPDWVRRPTGEDLARVYPAGAQRKGLNGAARVRCKVGPEGEMVDCKVELDTPLGEGFGQATLKLAPLFRVTPRTKTGQPVEGRSVTIPIRFVLPGNWNPRAEEEIAFAQACYGQIAHRAERDFASVEAWRATAYWSHQVVVAVAGGMGPPSRFENALAAGHAAAAAGTLKPPKGAELEACLAKASKK